MQSECPSMASLLHHGCKVTHFKNSRGWIETPDGRFFKPEPARVQFIKERNKPFIYAGKIKKGALRTLLELFKKAF
ncbi:phage filamentation protein Fil family protein [Kosakonia sp.]|uniref:phage filamentation protein Fil family protein n=1 Tax=Kosakonia sp. TaxID=1916651 RepID=UPI0028A8A248|nr:phage filamentation protein Fil family protein [Kosakonia sp.]